MGENLMRNILLALIAISSVAAQLPAAETRFSAIKLLDGYSAKQDKSVDASAWTITGKSGLIIHFEAGPSEGLAVDVKDKDKYEWYREQTVAGEKVYVALRKLDPKTDSGLNAERKIPAAKVLIVSFPLGGSRSHAANFTAKVANSEEIADVLLMALTFDQSKGIF
jgi:hypothetical protein